MERLGDVVYLGVKNKENVLYLLHFESKKEVRINGRVGGKYPPKTSAPGKVLPAYENHSCEFENEAEQIEKQGYATDKEEFAKGIICIACPIYDDNGRVIASAGISSLTIYDDINSIVTDKLPLLKQAARSISLNLGCVAKELYPFYNGEDIVDLLENLYDNLDSNNGYSMALHTDYNELTVQCLKAAKGKRRPMIELFVDKNTPDEIQ